MSSVSLNENSPIARARQLVLSEDVHPAALLTLAIKLLGAENVSTYEPATIRMELEDVLNLRPFPAEAYDKLMAAVAVLTTDLFFKDVLAFNELCNIMSGNPPAPDDYEPCDSLEMAWAVFQARAIDPMDGRNDQVEFSEDVKLYMGMILSQEGFMAPPSILKDAIMPPDADAVSSTYMEDAEILPTIVDKHRIALDQIEEAVGQYTNELTQQLEIIKAI